MTTEKTLTILMPCLNEEETIAFCIREAWRYVEASQLEAEILIVDNRSTDGSAQIARELGARVVAEEKCGYGNAIQAGIQAAQGKYIIMGDCDDSYNFLEIKPFYDKLLEGAEVVIGNRFRGGIEPGAMPFSHRYIGNPFLSWMGRTMYAVPIYDFH